MFSHECNAWGYFKDCHPLTVNPACQTAGTLDVQLHSLEGLDTLTVKCYRRRVWEMRHSGATGLELQFYFSDVWRSSLLQLTRSSNWQRESLFRCQMWPHWMYVPNNITRNENKLWWTRCHNFTGARNYISSTIQYNSRHQPMWDISLRAWCWLRISRNAQVTTV